MRHGEKLVLIVFFVGVVIVTILGLMAAPSKDLADRRLTTLRNGPAAASAVARTLERLGVRVERRRRPLYGIEPDPASTLVVLHPTVGLDPAEANTVVNWVRAGGAVFAAGATGLEACFELAIDYPVAQDTARAAPGALIVPAGVDSLAHASAVIEPAKPPKPMERAERMECLLGRAARTDTLLITRHAQPVAVRLHYGRGHVTLLADARYLSNRDVRDTDAGAMVLGWLLEPRPRRFVVDEYHHGFGGNRTLFGLSWQWITGSRAGPALLQLAGAALLALLVAAWRFGPPQSVLPRQRRSPLEHLDALAVGLGRSRDPRESVRLIVLGLRRRLGALSRGSDAEWLASLRLAAPGADAQRAVDQLSAAMAVPDQQQAALQTAHAAEDLWKALKRARHSAS